MIDVVIYTQGWAQDSPAKPGEQQNGQAGSRVYIGGIEVYASETIVKSLMSGFEEATIRFQPGKLSIIPLDAEEWAALRPKPWPVAVAEAAVRWFPDDGNSRLLSFFAALMEEFPSLEGVFADAYRQSTGEEFFSGKTASERPEP